MAEEQRTPPPDARVGAVLVLLADRGDGPSVVLTRRRRDLRSHPGQVSFPGGRLDDGETVEQAALREAYEEIGLDASSVELLGVGPTFYIPPSRFWVVPVAARWTDPHELEPNPWEVDAVLEVPITHLLERDRWRHVPLSLSGSTWAWQLEDDLLWGATAMVMAVLLEAAVDGWSEGLRPEDLGAQLAVRPWEEAPPVARRVRLEGDLPEVPQQEVAHVTASQMVAVAERLERLGVGLPQLAEQAGRAIAHTVRRLVGDAPLDGVRVTVAAGTGGNGAGGLVGARLLAAAGADVQVLLVGAPALPVQLDLLDAAGVTVMAVEESGVPDGVLPGEVLVDAVLGIGARPPLEGLAEVLAAWLRRHDVPTVSLDLPSGLSADDGLKGPCVTADVTVTLGAPKRSLLAPITHPYVGDLYLADLGIPPALWREVGVEPVVFDRGPLVRLTVGAAAGDAGTPDQGRVEP